jgi:hypothetical protein
MKLILIPRNGKSLDVEQKDGVDEMLSDVQIDVRDLLCVFSHYPFRFSALSGQVWRSELNIGVDNELKLLQTYTISIKKLKEIQYAHVMMQIHQCFKVARREYHDDYGAPSDKGCEDDPRNVGVGLIWTTCTERGSTVYHALVS